MGKERPLGCPEPRAGLVPREGWSRHGGRVNSGHLNQGAPGPLLFGDKASSLVPWLLWRGS